MASSQQKREEIKQLLTEGKSKNEIRSIFLDKYGPTILISPPFSGFNILAWTMPFIALAGAGYFIFRYIKDREKARANQTSKRPQKREEEIEDEILTASIEEEMKKYR